MASIAYLNAGFDKIMELLPTLVKELPDIPFIDEQRIALEKLGSHDGRKVVLHLWVEAVKAAEEGDRKAQS